MDQVLEKVHYYPMPRYQILVEYAGSNFRGWQVQKKGKTVQGLIQEKISKLLPLNYPVMPAAIVKYPSSKDVEELLDDNGIWICEFSYLPLMLKNLTFDQICHEHIMYYTLTVFEKILKNNNLKVLDAQLNEINGGSIELIISKKNCKRKIKKGIIDKLKTDEKKINKPSYHNFSKRILKIKYDLNNFINKKYPIAAYGASTKGNIVLNYAKLDSKKISYICDANNNKFGKFTPGSNIKIVSKQKC